MERTELRELRHLALRCPSCGGPVTALHDDDGGVWRCFSCAAGGFWEATEPARP